MQQIEHSPRYHGAVVAGRIAHHSLQSLGNITTESVRSGTVPESEDSAELQNVYNGWIIDWSIRWYLLTIFWWRCIHVRFNTDDYG